MFDLKLGRRKKVHERNFISRKRVACVYSGLNIGMSSIQVAEPCASVHKIIAWPSTGIQAGSQTDQPRRGP